MEGNAKASNNILKGKSINSPLLLLVSFFCFSPSWCRRKIGQPENLVFQRGRKRKTRCGKGCERVKKESSRIISNVQWGLQYFPQFLAFFFLLSLLCGFFGIIEAEFSTWKFYVFSASGTEKEGNFLRAWKSCARVKRKAKRAKAFPLESSLISHDFSWRKPFQRCSREEA